MMSVTMPTLIFTPRYTDDSQALWKAASSLGWSTERLAGWRIPDHLKTLDRPVLYGEALFGPSLAEQLGIELLNPPEDWLVRLPMEYKSRHIELSRLGTARNEARARFVKPPNDKSFPAGVYRGEDLPREFDDDTPVLVSDVVDWASEYRCFILDRQLRTCSVYSRRGELQREQGFRSTPEEVAAVESFIGPLLADDRIDLPQATVIDVGMLGDGRWACVEQNAAWGAGIYGCDPIEVLNVLQYACVKAHR